MNYKIVRIYEEIKVYKDDREIILVKRKSNWWGIQKSRFFIDGELILETTYEVVLFSLILKIKYQKLDEIICLKKKANNYYLECGKDKLSFKRTVFKNPQCILFKNDIKVGEIHGKLISFGDETLYRDVIFDTEDKTNLYLILLFLMKVPQALYL